eukprot:42376_1
MRVLSPGHFILFAIISAILCCCSTTNDINSSRFVCHADEVCVACFEFEEQYVAHLCLFPSISSILWQRLQSANIVSNYNPLTCSQIKVAMTPRQNNDLDF